MKKEHSALLDALTPPPTLLGHLPPSKEGSFVDPLQQWVHSFSGCGSSSANLLPQSHKNNRNNRNQKLSHSQQLDQGFLANEFDFAFDFEDGLLRDDFEEGQRGLRTKMSWAPSDSSPISSSSSMQRRSSVSRHPSTSTTYQQQQQQHWPLTSSSLSTSLESGLHANEDFTLLMRNFSLEGIDSKSLLDSFPSFPLPSPHEDFLVPAALDPFFEADPLSGSSSALSCHSSNELSPNSSSSNNNVKHTLSDNIMSSGDFAYSSLFSDAHPLQVPPISSMTQSVEKIEPLVAEPDFALDESLPFDDSTFLFLDGAFDSDIDLAEDRNTLMASSSSVGAPSSPLPLVPVSVKPEPQEEKSMLEDNIAREDVKPFALKHESLQIPAPQASRSTRQRANKKSLSFAVKPEKLALPPIPLELAPKSEAQYRDVGIRRRTKDALPTEWPQELLDMSVRELNRYIKLANLNKKEVADLKSVRRRKKNRLYARAARMAKFEQRDASPHDEDSEEDFASSILDEDE